MYLYVLDSFAQNKKYEKELVKIEHRLTDLELKGKWVKLTLLKNIKDVVQQGLKEGAETVVVIGGDQLFHQVVNILAGTNTVVSLIPLEKESSVASFFKLPYGVLACEILAQRLIKKYDLGKINQSYFLFQADLDHNQISLDFGSYKITPSQKNIITITNFTQNNDSFSPEDGSLEVVINEQPKAFLGKVLKKASLPSVFPFKKIKLSSSEPLPIKLDNQAIVKTPAIAEVLPKGIKIIVNSSLI